MDIQDHDDEPTNAELNYEQLQQAFELVTRASELLHDVHLRDSLDNEQLTKKVQGQLESTRNLRHALYAIASKAEELTDL